MKKSKIFSISIALALLGACVAAVPAEARCCTSFSLNLGALFAPPVYERRYVVEHYSPYYAPPVYVVPETYAAPAGYYIAPRQVVREVYVRQQPRVFSGAAVSWRGH